VIRERRESGVSMQIVAEKRPIIVGW